MPGIAPSAGFSHTDPRDAPAASLRVVRQEAAGVGQGRSCLGPDRMRAPGPRIPGETPGGTSGCPQPGFRERSKNPAAADPPAGNSPKQHPVACSALDSWIRRARQAPHLPAPTPFREEPTAWAVTSSDAALPGVCPALGGLSSAGRLRTFPGRSPAVSSACNAVSGNSADHRADRCRHRPIAAARAFLFVGCGASGPVAGSPAGGPHPGPSA